MIVKLCFYRDLWVNRLLTRSPYGHVNIQLPNGVFLNTSMTPGFIGYMTAYPCRPDKVVPIDCRPEHIQMGRDYAFEPMTILGIFKRNCVRFAALCVCGDDSRTDIIRALSEI